MGKNQSWWTTPFVAFAWDIEDKPVNDQTNQVRQLLEENRKLKQQLKSWKRDAIEVKARLIE